MSNESPAAYLVREAKDARILKDGRGTNPGGVRYVYDVKSVESIPSEQSERVSIQVCTLVNTGFIAMQGTSSAPNLHPREESGRVVIAAELADIDFYKI